MPETTPSAAPLDPSVVGTTFMRQYYQLLAKEPQSLHRFYKDESRWCHGQGSQMEAPIAGQRAINEQILQRGYAGARVDLDLGSIDCQASLDHGVVVLVTGVMTLPSGPQPKPFVQTFFLAVQPKGYFVLNDCLRFLELPGALDKAPAAPSAAKAPPAAKEPPQPVASPVKKPQPAASPVKKATPPAPVASPAKKEPVAAASPVKKAQTPVKKADKTDKLPETKAAEPAAAPPVTSPKKAVPGSPAKDKASAPPVSAPASAPAPAPVSAPAPAAPVVAAPAEPAAPKTWAALFSGKSAAAALAPAHAAAPVATAAAPTAAAAAPTAAPASAPAAAAPVEAKTASPSKAGEPSKERPRYFSLFIRDVPAQAKESELRELFMGFGAVAGVNIVTGRGYAFVDFVEQEAMRAALADPREFKLLDKTLHVEERSDRKEGQRGFRSDTRGGRGGRGSFGGRGNGGRSGERKDREDKKPAGAVGGRGDRGDRRERGARRGGRADGSSGRGE